MQKEKADWELTIIEDEPMTRTVCIPLTGEYLNAHDLYKFFNQYGEIRSVRIDRLLHDYKIGLVEFVEARSANEVLKSRIRIGNDRIEITLLDENYPPNYPPSSPLLNNSNADNVRTVTTLRQKIWKFVRFTRKHINRLKSLTLMQLPHSKSSKNILNALNDDCLHGIFRKLNLLSISNVADVCVRFNQIAKEVFATKYGRHNITSYQLKENGLVTLSQVEVLLRNFGSLMKSLKLDANMENFDGHDDNSNTILRMINEHCENLNELIIGHSFFIDDQKLNKINSLLSRLKTLRIDSCNSSGAIEDLIATCYQLESLEIRHAFGERVSINLQKFILPHLVELRLMSKLDGSSLEGFLQRSSQLKKLEIRTNSLIDIDAMLLFKLIGHGLPNIQELIFEKNQLLSQDSNAGQMHLSYLKHLKVLMIDFRSYSILPLMEPLSLNNNSIEYLGVMRAPIDDIGIGIICQMKCIKIIDLRASKGINSVHLIRLAKNLPHLKTLLINKVHEVTLTTIKTMLNHANHLSEFKISTNNIFHFNTIDYDELVEIVKKRFIRTKLYIEFSTNLYHNLGPNFADLCTNKVIFFNMHSDWLTVEKNYDYKGQL